MIFQIKSRVYALNKTFSNLLAEMRERYAPMKISQSELSLAISGKNTAPKSEKIVEYANEIVTEWEKQATDKLEIA